LEFNAIWLWCGWFSTVSDTSAGVGPMLGKSVVGPPWFLLAPPSNLSPSSRSSLSHREDCLPPPLRWLAPPLLP
jgi:hypothetical protein